MTIPTLQVVANIGGTEALSAYHVHMWGGLFVTLVRHKIKAVESDPNMFDCRVRLTTSVHLCEGFPVSCCPRVQRATQARLALA